MENNPYERPFVHWSEQERAGAYPTHTYQTTMAQPSPSGYAPNREQWAHTPRPTNQAHAARSAPVRLSKEQALARVRALKQYIVAASIICFSIFSSLVIVQMTASTTNASAPATPAVQPSSPTTPDDGSGGFFNQQQQGGYDFGSGNSQSAPYTRSHVS